MKSNSQGHRVGWKRPDNGIKRTFHPARRPASYVVLRYAVFQSIICLNWLRRPLFPRLVGDGIDVDRNMLVIWRLGKWFAMV